MSTAGEGGDQDAERTPPSKCETEDCHRKPDLLVTYPTREGHRYRWMCEPCWLAFESGIGRARTEVEIQGWAY